MPRHRPVGSPTRGTTAPNRLRRADRWLLGTQSRRILKGSAPPVMVDLGYGRVGTTTREWADRLSTLRPDLDVVGVEIDPERVAVLSGPNLAREIVQRQPSASVVACTDAARADAVAERAEQEPYLEATLAPGDLLYLPRGWLHAATALGEVPVAAGAATVTVTATIAVLDRAALRVGCAVIEPGDPRMGDRAGTHCARLEGDPQIAVLQPVPAERLGCGANRQHLGMRGRIAPLLDAVAVAGQQRPMSVAGGHHQHVLRGGEGGGDDHGE